MPFGLKPKNSRRLFMDLQEVCRGSKLFGKAWKGCMRGLQGLLRTLNFLNHTTPEALNPKVSPRVSAETPNLNVFPELNLRMHVSNIGSSQ